MIHSSGNVGGWGTSGTYEHGARSVTCSGVYQGKRRKDRTHRCLQLLQLGDRSSGHIRFVVIGDMAKTPTACSRLC